jgi:hypothetical protein
MKLAAIATQKSECAIGTRENWTIEPASALLGRSIWRHIQGASFLVDDSQG